MPERLIDDGAAQLDSRIAEELKSGLRACIEASESSELIARRAARRTLAQLDARRSLGLQSVLSRRARVLVPRIMLAALGLALVLRFGGALAEELGPRAIVRIGDWVERGVALLEPSRRRSPGPTIVAPPHEASSAALAPATALDTPPSPDAAPAIVRPPPAAAAIQTNAQQARRRAVVHSPLGPGPAANAAPDPLGSEAVLVSRAVALARADSRAALSLLASYWRDYPSGALRGEAAVAEISALEELGKRTEALSRLDGWARDDLRSMGEAGKELSLSRLELMVDAGRCSEALPLLQRELEATEAPRLRGRALLAHAACSGKLGDPVRNRADLESYLRELPGGPRAAQVRRALGLGD